MNARSVACLVTGLSLNVQSASLEAYNAVVSIAVFGIDLPKP